MFPSDPSKPPKPSKSSKSDTGLLGRRVYPPQCEKKDREYGWRLDWKGLRAIRGVPTLILELQPNKEAAMKQLRKHARRSHTSLGLLRIPLDKKKKLPENMDVMALFKLIVDEKDMQEIKDALEREDHLEKVKGSGREWKGTKGNAKQGRK